MRRAPRLVGRQLFSVTGLTLAIALAVVACAARLPSVRLEGTDQDLKRLVGNWTGEYVSDTAGEAGGSIIFRLESTDAQANGDVLMTRRGARTPYAPYEPEHGTGRSLGTQSLAIRFVRTDDGALNGELDPYWDFDRACEARTVFRGSVRGHIIEGTYETTFSGPYQRRTGRWKVVRSVRGPW